MLGLPILDYSLSQITKIASPPALSLGGRTASVVWWSGRYAVIDFANRVLPNEALILSFRQNDSVFYGRHRILRHLDPRMMPVYKAKDVTEAYQALRALGVDYIFVPSYVPVTISNSALADLLSDPKYVHIVYQREGARLLRLFHPNEIRSYGKQTVFSCDSLWTRVSMKGHGVVHGAELSSTERNVTFYSGSSALSRPPPTPTYLEGGRTYRFRAKARFRGWIDVYLVTYPDSGGFKKHLLWQSIGTGRERRLSGMIHIAKGGPYRLLLEVSSRAGVEIRDVVLERIDIGTAYAEAAIPGISECMLHWVTGGAGCPEHEKAREAGVIAVSGPGNPAFPPSAYGAVWPEGPLAYNGVYEAEVEGYGKGDLDISIIGYRMDGTSEQWLVEQVSLPGGKIHWKRYLFLPAGYSEFRVVWSIPQKQGRISSIYHRLIAFLVKRVWVDQSLYKPGELKLTTPLHIRYVGLLGLRMNNLRCINRTPSDSAVLCEGIE